MQRDTSRRSERQARELNLLLANWPALAAYITRIGAVTRNFKSHALQVMDEDSGYWRDRVRIKVESDGHIDVTVIPRREDPEEIDPTQFEPTASEQEGIKAEAAKGYPHSVKVSRDTDRPAELIGVNQE